MNFDSQFSSRIVTFTYDSANRLVDVSEIGVGPSESPELPRESLDYQSRAAAFGFEHDPQKGIFRLERADGEVEVFRDKPARYLVVEPDSETGEVKPVVERGRPVYLYLCREEREVR
jgi:hypothetical protein